MAFLRVTSGQFFGRDFALEDFCQLGRSPDCHLGDLFACDESVSRRHACISRIGDQYQLRDESRFGTLINGQSVSEPVFLSHGDRIGICSFELEFLEGTCPQGPVPDFAAAAEQTHFLEDSEGTSIESEISAQVPSPAETPSAAVRLDAILEMVRALQGSLALSTILENLLSALFKIFPQVECGFVGLRDEESQKIVPAIVKRRDGKGRGKVAVSRLLADHVMKQKAAVLCTDTRMEPPFQDSDSIPGMQIRSVMCVPLLDTDGHSLGMIQVDSQTAGCFQPSDLELLASLAPQASFACQFAKLHQDAMKQQQADIELHLAQQVQQSSLPQTTPELADYEFFHYYRPARELSGDFFDYVQLPDGRLAIIQADVVGKGIAAALTVSRLYGELRHLLRQQSSLGAAVTELNKWLCAQTELQIITIVALALDSGKHELSIVNGGHPPPILRSSDGDVGPFGSEAHGLLLGAEEEYVYTEQKRSLLPGELLVAYTDGFSEAKNIQGQFLGHEPLLSVIRPGASAEQVGQSLIREVRQFIGGGEQSDDMCLVCLQRRV